MFCVVFSHSSFLRHWGLPVRTGRALRQVPVGALQHHQRAARARRAVGKIRQLVVVPVVQVLDLFAHGLARRFEEEPHKLRVAAPRVDDLLHHAVARFRRGQEGKAARPHRLVHPRRRQRTKVRRQGVVAAQHRRHRVARVRASDPALLGEPRAARAVRTAVGDAVQVVLGAGQLGVHGADRLAGEVEHRLVNGLDDARIAALARDSPGGDVEGRSEVLFAGKREAARKPAPVGRPVEAGDAAGGRIRSPTEQTSVGAGRGPTQVALREGVVDFVEQPVDLERVAHAAQPAMLLVHRAPS